MEHKKNFCPWCRGNTFDDYYGNCCACGGPRDKEEIEEIVLVKSNAIRIPSPYGYVTCCTSHCGDFVPVHI